MNTHADKLKDTRRQRYEESFDSYFLSTNYFAENLDFIECLHYNSVSC